MSVISMGSRLIAAAANPTHQAGHNTLTDILTPDIGLALMNLHLHGCMDVGAANQLCDLELAAPTTFTRRVPGVGLLSFKALELELSGYLEIGRIDQGRAIRHRLLQDAFARMATDQCAGATELVFESSYLEGLQPAALVEKHKIAAEAWLRPPRS